ncbi:AraC family transcriptional regulator [Breoghania sp.]|uniref:helix-turn-helix domain-containing protein n=1 Tax=Breoghania sp. TaxID=2065378 RepID=UPI00261E219C|nr:AraC family transcriptional regulator [Breoghania sp.]MDJ0931120.1 AraC family transcriptional regulator [Breoghania sp.]
MTRLSRRLGIPVRHVSRAINRKLVQTVPRVINEWRIREAMNLLAETDYPVTTVMFDCGFQTKSNFNREFARITGTSPSRFLRKARENVEFAVNRVVRPCRETG